ncbi:MAG: protein kinase [Acidobacteriota bacterium]
MSISPGSHLGPYEILAAIGAGGMGEVYRARDPRLGREVAIKVLPESFSADPDRLRRFEQEARAAGMLNHPNITAVLDIGEHEGAPYVVQELLEGETLRDVLAAEQLSVRRAMDYAGQIAEGLAAAHEKGIVHRDLKPENLVVTRGGRVKILDFGLAKLIRPDGATGDVTEGPTLSGGTEPGVILGTVGYMSPEQVRGQNADHRSDIFAFGAILHEMLTGQRAFQRDSAVETMTAILREEPPDISQNQAISPSLDHIMRHCLEKRPEERFHSARDLAFALREVSSGPPTPGAAPRVGWPRQGVFLFAAAGIVLLALALGSTVGGWGKRLPGSAKPAAIQSLAVLPLANLSGDPEQEYFADGMTEALITSLAQLSGLRVISRTSVMQYKNVRKPLTEIARELKVEGIVEGSVMRAGARVRITAQLIQAATDKHLWAQDYERDLRDVLTLQSEVARAIAREVQVKIGPEEQGRLKKSQRVDPSAYEAYLKGRYHWNKRTEEGIKTGVSFFEQAIQLDPTYAPAYAGVADSYVVLQSHRFVPSAEAHPKAKAAARKALEIDETLSEAHASMASVLWDDSDSIGAEREFQRAIQLNPGYSTARQWYGEFLSQKGEHERAITEARRAVQLDPLSLMIHRNLGMIYYMARRYDLAIQQFRATLEIGPDFSLAHSGLGWVYLQTGMRKEAIAELESARALSGADPGSTSALGYAYGVAGEREKALRLLDELKERSKGHYVSPFDIAVVYVGLGEKEQAFEWLRKACEERAGDLGTVNRDPAFDGLRADSRFAALARCIAGSP